MTTYRLHYIGMSALYSQRTFEEEAMKLGASRAIPSRILGGFSWGDAVLTAKWVPDRERQASWKQAKLVDGEEPSRHFRRIGSAEVFGYFRVTGLNMDAPAQAKTMLAMMLKVVGVSFPNVACGRACGSYTISASYEVTDTIAEILEKAGRVEERLGVRFKWFVAGRYEPVGPITLDPAQFTRGYARVEIDGLDLRTAENAPTVLNFVEGYARRHYVPRGEREEV